MSRKSEQSAWASPQILYLANLSDIPQLAKKLSSLVRPGDTLALSGNLGSGKTTFTQHLGKYLGFKNKITSPTFTVLNMHKTEKKKSMIKQLLHIDLYRTKDHKELGFLGLEDLTNDTPSLTVIEWAEKAKDTISKNAVSIKFTGLICAILFFGFSAHTTHAATTSTVSLENEQLNITLGDVDMLDWRGNYQVQSPIFFKEKKRDTVTLNPALVYYWINNSTQAMNQGPVEPELEISNDKAILFSPPQNGVAMDSLAITKSLLQNQKSRGTDKLTLSAGIYTSKPKKSLADMNNLGIEELVAKGQSTFTGSSSNRRTNVSVGFKKVRGVILAPNEVFSFNDNLGSVEAKDGFKPEIVIKKTGLTPELGGGICQVSSTVFRAAMAAGLPIVERKNHSFAVQHYAPQGTDATTYTGAVDFKFQNDTGNNLLVWAYLKDKDNLIFELWGKKDDRVVDLKDPVQYDRKSDGSMKADWVRSVTKNGETTTKTFHSVYLPPALFQKKEEFVPAATTPPVTPTPQEPETPTNTTPPV